MYEDKRQIIGLSKECWESLEKINDVSYANAFTLFFVQNTKVIDNVIKEIAPSIQDGLFRFRYEGKLVTFSLSEKTIAEYKPKIHEFSSFGSAVKILGAYEYYLLKMAKISNQRIPERMKIFKDNHGKKFTSPKLGRGIDFFQEVFGFNPNPSYRSSLMFMFELRNIAVHNMNIINPRVYNALKSDDVIIKGNFEIGNVIEWNLSLLLQLVNLITSILSEVDQIISSDLKLPTINKNAYWFID